MSCGIHKGRETKPSQRRPLAFGWRDSTELTVDTMANVDRKESAHARMELLSLDLIEILNEQDQIENLWEGSFARVKTPWLSLLKRVNVAVSVLCQDLPVPFMVNIHPHIVNRTMPPYNSLVPSVPLFAHSVFTHLFSSAGPNDVGGFHASLPAFIDTVTGTTITRGQLKHLALSLAYGLQNHPVISAKRGETVLIYSQNSLAWPVVLFGSGRCFYLSKL